MNYIKHVWYKATKPVFDPVVRLWQDFKASVGITNPTIHMYHESRSEFRHYTCEEIIPKEPEETPKGNVFLLNQV